MPVSRDNTSPIRCDIVRRSTAPPQIPDQHLSDGRTIRRRQSPIDVLKILRSIHTPALIKPTRQHSRIRQIIHCNGLGLHQTPARCSPVQPGCNNMTHNNYTLVPQRHLHRPAQPNAVATRNAQPSAAHDPDRKKSNLPTSRTGMVNKLTAIGKCTELNQFS